MRLRPRPRETIEAGAGAPVVLVHGFGCSPQWWATTAASLATSFRVVVPVLPGFGGTAPLPGPFSLDALADWLGDELARRDLAPADVVGHSMGGSLALRLALRRPEAVRRIVLVGSSGLPDPRSAAIVVLSTFTEGVRAPRGRWPMILGDVLRADLGVLRAAAGVLMHEDLTERLGEVRAPALLVWGARDVLVPPVYAHRFAAGLADSRTEIFSRSSHMPMWDEPERFERLVAEFLEDRPKSRQVPIFHPHSDGESATDDD